MFPQTIGIQDSLHRLQLKKMNDAAVVQLFWTKYSRYVWYILQELEVELKLIKHFNTLLNTYCDVVAPGKTFNQQQTNSLSASIYLLLPKCPLSFLVQQQQGSQNFVECSRTNCLRLSTEASYAVCRTVWQEQALLLARLSSAVRYATQNTAFSSEQLDVGLFDQNGGHKTNMQIPHMTKGQKCRHALHNAINLLKTDRTLLHQTTSISSHCVHLGSFIIYCLFV